MADSCGVMVALAGRVTPPSELLVDKDAGLYADLYDRYIGNLKEIAAMWVDCRSGGEKVASRSCGYAETVVSSAVPLGGPVAAAVASVPVVRGRWYESNKAKRERRRRLAVGGSAGGGVVPPRTSLQESLDRKREAENLVAEKKARAELELLNDPVLAEMAREAARKKVVGQTAVAACRAAKSLSDLEAVSPGSSASRYEVRQFQEQMRQKDRLILDLEASLREVDEAEARRIMQADVKRGLFSLGVDGVRAGLSRGVGPGESFVNEDGETVTACVVCGIDCTCDMSDME